MSVTLAQRVTMKSFKRLIASLSPDVSLCVRGRHAVGKSEGTYQGAKELGLPVVERRLSQMTEGDLIGLPAHEGGATVFKPCAWLMEASEKPVVLFLDERNRALPAVKQAVFQLMDSKRFYNMVLHPDTRVVVAENTGDAYQVEENDPAEVSRAATVTLDPTVDEWVDYAKTICHPLTVEYVRINRSDLEHEGQFEPNKKYPDRRSWIKLDAELRRSKLFEDPSDHLLYVMAGAFLGPEVGGKFTSYVREHARQVSADDILCDWAAAKKRLAPSGEPTNEQYMECVEKLKEHLGQEKYKKSKMHSAKIQNLAAFTYDAPAEIALNVQSLTHDGLKVSTMLEFHGLIEPLILAIAGASGKTRDEIPKIEPTVHKRSKKTTKSASTPKRGQRRKGNA